MPVIAIVGAGPGRQAKRTGSGSRDESGDGPRDPEAAGIAYSFHYIQPLSFPPEMTHHPARSGRQSAGRASLSRARAENIGDGLPFEQPRESMASVGSKVRVFPSASA